MHINRRGLFAALVAAAFVPTGLTAQEQTPDQGASAVQTDEIKRVMIYGDLNTWGYIPVEASPTERFDAETRAGRV